MPLSLYVVVVSSSLSISAFQGTVIPYSCIFMFFRQRLFGVDSRPLLFRGEQKGFQLDRKGGNWAYHGARPVLGGSGFRACCGPGYCLKCIGMPGWIDPRTSC